MKRHYLTSLHMQSVGLRFDVWHPVGENRKMFYSVIQKGKELYSEEIYDEAMIRRLRKQCDRNMSEFFAFAFRMMPPLTPLQNLPSKQLTQPPTSPD